MTRMRWRSGASGCLPAVSFSFGSFSIASSAASIFDSVSKALAVLRSSALESGESAAEDRKALCFLINLVIVSSMSEVDMGSLMLSSGTQFGILTAKSRLTESPIAA